MRKVKYQIASDKQGQYRFNVIASNGKHLCHSAKGYATKEFAIKALSSLLSDSFVEIETANIEVNGHAVYVKFIDSNGSTLAVSDIYKSEGHRNTYNQVIKSASKLINVINGINDINDMKQI